MANDKFLEIVIDADGNITSEVHGVLGPDCEDLAEWVKGLGVVTEDRRTPDYHRSPHQTVSGHTTVGG